MAFLQNIQDSGEGAMKSGGDGLGATLGGVTDVGKNVGENVADLASAPVDTALQGAEKAKQGLGMMAMYLNMPYELLVGAILSFIVAVAVAVWATGSSGAAVRGAVIVSVFMGWAAVVRILFLRKLAETERKMI
ncbi:hypothetical protein FB45DRAFT_1063812 [Roridomyces roridus]|uniref:Uncharacterized protein n=1 Tax=Roridomyces roridus TaxID=1738132 RepID=A0AAD7BD87_9AGAR|nr:hypothetical protein FB45DRAFT_1063812 [Roridomyces roridus]